MNVEMDGIKFIWMERSGVERGKISPQLKKNLIEKYKSSHSSLTQIQHHQQIQNICNLIYKVRFNECSFIWNK